MKRIDEAERFISAPPPEIYEAFASPAAMAAWLPPEEMSGEMLAFDFHEGGGSRMRLTYVGTEHARGKSAHDADEVDVRLVRLIPGQSIGQEVVFETDDVSSEE